jgi:hypothetical protein
MTEGIACTPEIFERILEEMRGGKTLAQVLDIHKEGNNYPSLSTVYKYTNNHSEARAQYTQARENCADALADDILRVAESTLDPQRARNQITARQWLASKIKPKVYGDKLDVDVNNRIDISLAIQQGRQRAQVIDNTMLLPAFTSDIQSDAKEEIDPFS